MNGFYEWHKESSKKKQPYYIHLGEDYLVNFAALYDTWDGTSCLIIDVRVKSCLDAGELLYTVSIVTTDASAKLRWLHDRMPVLLPDEASVDLWLSREEVEWKRLEALLKPYNGEDLLYHPVTEKMGNVRFQGEECYKDIRKKGLDAFFTPTKRTKKRRQEKAEVSEAEEVSKKKIKREVKTEVKKETTINIEVPKKEEEEMTGLTRLHGCKRSGPLQREETSPLRKSARLLKKHEIKE